MPAKAMRSLFFHPKAPSFSFSSHSSPSRSSISSPTPQRSSSAASNVSETMVDEVLGNGAVVIMKWNPDSSAFGKLTSLFHECKKEAQQFIKCVNDLQRVMHFLVSNDPTSEKLVHAQSLMQVAMKRLQKEFYQIHSMNRAHLDPESVSTRSRSSNAASSTSDDDIDDGEDTDLAGDSISEVEQVSFMAMTDLKSIAECMISSGYAKECVYIYNMIRKSIIDEALYKLGVEKFSSSQINKMDREILELKLKSWLNAVKLSMTTLFNGERILCDHVFAVSKSIRESCFAHIARGAATLLFSFPQVLVAKPKKKYSEENIFRLLDMYTAISELWPEIESIFGFESTATVRSEALNSLVRLGELVRSMLSEFETSVQKDSSKSPVAGGGVHPLTLRVMSYLSLLTDYSNVLADIFIDWTPPEKLPSPEWTDSSVSAESLRMVWFILVLVCKLDEKAKQYKEVSLSYLFLANNLQHVISIVRTSNLQYLLGEEWISKHESKVQQFAANYERLAWGAVLSSLPEIISVEMSSQEARLIFRNFNFSLEETYQKQKLNVVADAKLRDEIKASVTKKIVSVYKEFYDKHKVSVSSVGNAAIYARFTPEDVANYLSNLY
ncbi:exocyst complex component EXO70H1-like [Argentina anserina]|uniref:exocyst complex component EXO70H1-like n=1 Tax=Argentina anserina TaxID=57926 RepID=UPI0021767340|nr:exocyst complex component EXO70H1-like [Potentilla anserina]